MKTVFRVLMLIVAGYLALHSSVIFTQSSLIEDLDPWKQTVAGKNPALQDLIRSLHQGHSFPWIAGAAPVLHWHPDERYRASDPLIYFNSGEIFYREVFPVLPFLTRRETRLGKAQDHMQLFSPGETTRLFERQSLKQGYAGYELRYDPELPADGAAAPLLWRLSLSPLFRDVQDENTDRLLVPIEYWYHIAYNPVSVYFGSHDGDWESFMVVFDVRRNGDAFTATPAYFNTSAHGNSDWHCADELRQRDGRWQLFSALGTHATYTTPGTHWRVYPDRTGSGEDPRHEWNTRENLRPVVREPYYGFSGSWGRTSFVNWMNGPLPPGPGFKYLPRSSDGKARSDWKELTARCAHRHQ